MHLFSRTETYPESLRVLITIESASVSASFAYIKKNGTISLYGNCNERVSLNDTDKEGEEKIVQALTFVLETLHQKYAKQVFGQIKNGKSMGITVSFSSPWCKTELFTKTIEKTVPFIFSPEMEHQAVADLPAPPDQESVQFSRLAVFLNGYHIGIPEGKKAHRADIVFLRSVYDKTLKKAAEERIRNVFRHGVIEYKNSLYENAYALSEYYRHEKNVIVLTVSGNSTDALLIKNSLVVGSQNFESGYNVFYNLRKADDTILFQKKVQEIESLWAEGVVHTLKAFGDSYSLPRTLFLIAPDDVREFVLHLLQTETLNTLWLSTDGLRIIPVLPKNFTPLLEDKSFTKLPLQESLAALALRTRLKNKK